MFMLQLVSVAFHPISVLPGAVPIDLCVQLEVFWKDFQYLWIKK